MNKPQVIVLNNIGGGFDILVHRLPHANETVMMHGMLMSEDLAKGGNVAVALSRLGVSTAIIGKIGCDEAGRRDAAWMDEAGVDLSELLRDPTVTTGQGIGLIADDGQNIMITGESSSAHLTEGEVMDALGRLAGAGWFVCGLEVRPQLVLPAMRRAHELGMRTVLNPSPVPDEGIELPLVGCDLLFVNEVELCLLLGRDPAGLREGDVEGLCRSLAAASGCGTVVATLGADGAAVLEGDAFTRVAPVRVEAVDASGAGDGFMAATVARLISGDALVDACRWASAYAALSVTRRDCLPGYATPAEVEDFTRANGITI
ncbi:MAG: ribokinase [Atopobiaceae bacterium]|nr:ribokinase [Atopobiaceae bacterium]